nr:MAG TPA: hypothetical protein [Crassvirales sp.]
MNFLDQSPYSYYLIPKSGQNIYEYKLFGENFLL